MTYPIRTSDRAERDAADVARLRGLGWSSTRIMSGLGIPGFGAAYCRRAIARMEEFGLTAHEAVFGGLSAERQIEAVRSAR